MNAYMQEKPSVAHVSATQLVNDKKFAKEWKKQHGKVDSTSPAALPAKAHQPSPPVQVDTETVGAVDMRQNWSTRPSTFYSSNVEADDVPSKNEHVSSPSTTAADVAPSLELESQSNPGVEVTLGHFELKSVTSKIPRTPSDVSGTPSWSSVQLRAVRQESTEVRNKSKTPNFAKLQLRKVQRPSEVTPALMVDTQDQDLSPPPPPPPQPAPKHVESSQTEAAKRPIVDAPLLPPAAPKAEGTTKRDQKPTRSSSDQKDASSETKGKNKIDEAFCFNLKTAPDDADGVQNKIIFGRKHIMMVKAKPGIEQADVVWKLLRPDVASLTIDMTQMMVKLISHNGSTLRELKFETSGDCLKFANTFYDLLQNRIGMDAGVEKSKVNLKKTAVEVVDDDGDTEFAAVRLERLNDEEQAVLDTYRRLRRSKPPKDALVESVSKEVNTDTPQSLSEEDEKVASKYRKMLKLQIPGEAVRHSMSKDGVGQHIIDAVLGANNAAVPANVETDGLPTSPVSTFSNSTGLSESDGILVEKYKKMLKMGISCDAVRHKLARDGVDVKLHDLIFESTAVGTTVNPKANSLNPPDEAVAAHYRKLISRGVPKDSVRFGMAKDNVAPHIIAAVLGETPETHNVGSVPAKKASDDGLSPEEEKIASQFKKLLKRQIPRQQILDRMKSEGVSDKVIVAVLGKRGLAVSTKEDAPKGNTSRFVQLHWTPLSDSQLDNSVWKNRSFELASPEASAISKLKELFEKKTNKSMPKDRKASLASDGPKKAKLLDINRSNNIAISLKAFKDYSYGELSEIIRFLDPLRRLHGERVHFLRDLLPTVSETKLVQSFDGPDSMLGPAERWFKSIVGIKRIEAKVRVLRTMEMLEIEARSIGENLRLLTKVCNQVIHSDRLQDLLVVVLQIGNIMNEGTRTGRAAGFKLDSLLKLTQTKSADGKTTVLDYLVEDLFIAKGERHKLDLNSDFPESSTASRMLIGDLVAEVKAMHESVAQCKTELEALRKESLGKNTGVSSAIAKIESQEKNSIHGAIRRLESFIGTAEEIVDSLSKEKDEALQASRELCMYCGEGGGTAAATTLLGILSEFANNIESAVRKFDEKKKAKERRLKRQAEEMQPGQSVDVGDVPEQNGESLVLLVNKMLKDANPRTIEDFKKGRVLDNPSQLMKTIYQKEQTMDIASNEHHRSSLASAIQEKSEELNDGDFLVARTKFGSPRENSNQAPPQPIARVRSPPLPWSPPEREKPGNGKQQSPQETLGSSEAGSLVTDSSTAISSLADSAVENTTTITRRPTERPTPEGVPLRDKRNSTNIGTTDNITQVSSRRHLTPPAPETSLRSTGLEKPPTVKLDTAPELPTEHADLAERNSLQKKDYSSPPDMIYEAAQDSIMKKSATVVELPESPDPRTGRVSALAVEFTKTDDTALQEVQAAGEKPEHRPDPPHTTADPSKPDPPTPPTKSSGIVNSGTDLIFPVSSTLTHEGGSKQLNTEGDTSFPLFNTAAARTRFSARERTDQSVIQSPELSQTSGVSCGPKKPAKSLQELATLKRERRSIEKSPLKSQAQSTPDQQTNLSGHREKARQRRSIELRSGLMHKATASHQESGEKIPSSAPSNDRESSFARMAREKRAARKNGH